VLGGIAGKKPEGGRENYIVAKGGPADEADSRQGGKGQQKPLFMLVETGGDKTPDLIENYRAGQEDAADKSDFQVKKNPSWYEVKINDECSGNTLRSGSSSQSPSGWTKE